MLLAFAFVLFSQSSLAADAGQERKDTEPALQAASSGKYALLVGINDYKVRRLYGALNDIADMKSLLVNAFGFPDDGKHIIELPDKFATKKSILDSFRQHLIEHARNDPDGYFVFQFSGHGLQIPDDAGHDETDLLDEALVPYDVNKKAFKNVAQLREALIVDDQLSDLLVELAGLTANILVVTDCCFSGTNLRVNSPTTRALQLADFGLVEKRSSKAQSKGITSFCRDFDIDKIGKRYVAISGSDSYHAAIEKPVVLPDKNTKVNGLMTWNLMTLLKACKSDVTYRELGDRLRSNIYGVSAQNPQIEGDLDRHVFSNYRTKVDPSFAVKKCEDNKVTIDAGSSSGIRIGTLISFYEPGRAKLSGKEGLLETGTVIQVDPFDSIVEIENSKSDGIVQSKAVVSAFDSATGKLPVYFDCRRPTGISSKKWAVLKKDIEDLLEVSGTVKRSMVEEDLHSGKKTGDTEQLLIVADTYQTFVDDGGTLRSDRKPEPAPDVAGFYICRKRGQAVANSWVAIDQSNAAQKVVEAAQVVSTQDTVRRIFNERSDLDGQLEVKLWRVEQRLTQTGANEWVKTKCLSDSTEAPIVKFGEWVQLCVTNKSAQPLKVNVLSLGPSGSIKRRFPPVAGATEVVAKGTTIELEPLKLVAPQGSETLKVFASTNELKLDILSQHGIDPLRSGRRTGGPQLRRIILRAAGLRTRQNNDRLPGDVEEDWVSRNIDFSSEP